MCTHLRRATLRLDKLKSVLDAFLVRSHRLAPHLVCRGG